MDHIDYPLPLPWDHPLWGWAELALVIPKGNLTQGDNHVKAMCERVWQSLDKTWVEALPPLYGV